MNKILTIVLLLAFCATVSFAQTETKTDAINKNKVNQTSSTNVANYDFTTGADKFYGGANGAKQIETGVWGMIAGDANGDGSVNAIDFNDNWLPQNGTPYDYSKTGDFNLDGSINAVDYNEFWLPNNGTATQVPN
jgi:hypothetical protein